MKKPIESGIVHLWDLPKDIILVGLKEKYKKSIFRHIKDLDKLFSKDKRYLLYNLKNNQKVKLSFLLKLSSILVNKGFKGFNRDEIEKNIKIIGTKRGNTYIFYPKLPFNFNSESGAYFISAILFDGGIDKQYKPHYGNINLEQRKRIVKCANNIFGNLKNKESNPDRGYLVRFPKCMGILLNYCFNIGIGNKMYCNNSVPNFIFKLPNKLKGAFLKQAFDDEGTISIEKRMIRINGTIDVKKDYFNTEYTIKDYKLLNDIKKLLLDINIETNPIRITGKSHYNKEYRKIGDYYRHTFIFSIADRKNLEKFYSLVNFNLDYKKTRLKKILDNYKVWQLRKGEIHKIAIEKAKILQNKYGYFDNILLSNRIKRSYRQTARITDKLLYDRKIKIIKEAVPIGRGYIPKRFVLLDSL